MSEKKQPTSPSKSKVDLGGFWKFQNEFLNESDRAAVILGAAKLDQLLYLCLRKFLLPNPASTDELFDGDGPLSTFSTKINLTYRLGLIDSEFARVLHLVRRIRNDFAHEPTGTKLESAPHRDRVKELRTPFLTIQDYEGAQAFWSPSKKGIAADLFTALAFMVMRLEILFDELTPLDTRQQHVLIPRHLKKAND